MAYYHYMRAESS